MRRPVLPKKTVSQEGHRIDAQPNHTCPDIDGLINSLEELRKDNAALRYYGEEWHDLALEYYGLLEEMNSYIDDLERQIELLNNEQ